MKHWFILCLATGDRIAVGFASKEEAIAHLTRHGEKWPDDFGYTAVRSEIISPSQWDALSLTRQLRADAEWYEDELREMIKADKQTILRHS